MSELGVIPAAAHSNHPGMVRGVGHFRQRGTVQGGKDRIAVKDQLQGVPGVGTEGGLAARQPRLLLPSSHWPD